MNDTHKLTPIAINPKDGLENNFYRFMQLYSADRVADLTNSVQRDIENRAPWFFALVLSAVLGFMLTISRYWEAVSIILILGILVVLTMIKETIDRNGLLSEHVKMFKEINNFKRIIDRDKVRVSNN